MKQKNRWLITIVVLLFSIAVNAKEEFTVEGITYTLTSTDDETCSVTGIDSKNGKVLEVQIPSTVHHNGKTYRVTSIGDEAFFGYSNLAKVTIPESVIEIGEDAFTGTAWYRNQPDGVIYVNYVLYKYKGKMPKDTKITVKEGTVSITPSAFLGCDSLTAITFPESMTSIGEYAFYDCNGLTSITIPENVTKIGWATFCGCNSLTTVIIPKHSRLALIEERTFSGCNSLTAITIPEGVTEIGNSAFDGCGNLASVTIPEGVTKIGNSVFYGCSKITSINIPASVTEIGEFAFYKCNDLNAVHIDSIKAWCNIDFGNYSTPSLYHAPKSLIGKERRTASMPVDTKNVEAFTVGDYNDLAPAHKIHADSWGNVDFGKYSANPLFHAHNLYVKGELVTELTIPKGVVEIRERTFLGCDSLTAITISESVTQIGNSAFDGCHSLKSVICEDADTVLALGYNGNYQGLFYDCPLEMLYIGRNLNYDNSVPNGCSPFFNRTNLTTLTISDKVTSIEDDAFNSCSSLTSITIPESVTSIGNSAFYACSSLTSINIPEGVTEIRGDAFTGTTWYSNQPDGVIYVNYVLYKYKGKMPKDTKITVKEGTVSITPSAFLGCDSLTAITFPESMTSIGEYAFYDCNGLKTITCHPNIPPMITKDAFDSNIYKQAKLIVPKGTKETYLKATGWKYFENISEPSHNAIQHTLTELPTKTYDLNGQELQEPQRGINIINGRKVLIR